MRFNPRTHMGCDLLIIQRFVYQMPFQSTHPHGVRLNLFNIILTYIDSFNPRTHMGCDCAKKSILNFSDVFQSTHPHGVRLCAIAVFTTLSCVSIHAPTWGATHIPFVGLSKSVGFNPRTHMGCDTSSILTFQNGNGFNPRTHMGCDICKIGLLHLKFCFNPRTHMGCDDKPLPSARQAFSFNPRTHMGCDCIFSKCLNITLQS